VGEILQRAEAPGRALSQTGGSLQDRFEGSITGGRPGDRAIEEGADELKRRVKEISEDADRIDTDWSDYRANCLQNASIPRGYDPVRVQPGRMFWFRRKKLAGSYFRLSALSRSYLAAP